MRHVLYTAGMLIVFGSIATPLLAVASVPEIDGGSMSTGLGLLAGGILLVRARWGRRSGDLSRCSR